MVDVYGDNPCPLGLQAIYEKSVALEDRKAAIDEQYRRVGVARQCYCPREALARGPGEVREDHPRD